MRKKIIRYLVVFIVCITTSLELSSQYVYKTPSGNRYHRYDCRMVDNVSKRMQLNTAVSKHGLTQCKICDPPVSSTGITNLGSRDKSVGACTSVQCSGITKRGTRCKHKTKLCNGYCYQHNPSAKSPPKRKRAASTSNRSFSSTCGARTKSGGYCRRKVKGGGRCYQHY